MKGGSAGKIYKGAIRQCLSQVPGWSGLTKDTKVRLLHLKRIRVASSGSFCHNYLLRLRISFIEGPADRPARLKTPTKKFYEKNIHNFGRFAAPMRILRSVADAPGAISTGCQGVGA